MRKETIDKLKDLNRRIHCSGFSWRHDDFFLLQEVLPELVGGFGDDASQPAVQADVHLCKDIKKCAWVEDVCAACPEFESRTA